MRLSLNTLGIILGVFFTIVYGTFSVVTWHRGVDAYVAALPWMKFGWETFVVILLIVAGLWWRQGYMPFKRAVQYAFLALVLYEIGYALVNVAIYDIIDKGFNHQMIVTSLQKELVSAGRMGLSTDQIKDTLAKELAHPSGPLTFFQLLLGFGQSLLFDFVKSMLVALAIQKKLPTQ
jgi:hypothetical protein